MMLRHTYTYTYVCMYTHIHNLTNKAIKLIA
jgi:hypothetical protein